MDWMEYEGVEVIPGKVGGVPLLKGTRVPANLVEECLAAGDNPKDIAYNYDLKLEDVLRLKAYRDVQQPALQL